MKIFTQTHAFNNKIPNKILSLFILPNKHNVLILSQTGSLYLYHLLNGNSTQLLTLPENIKLADLRLYCFSEYAAIVENRGLLGFVFHLNTQKVILKLQRNSYHAEYCSFPIGFCPVKDDTYLIHGTDWNRLDITSLKTGRCFTERIIDYQTRTNYVDYFHSRIFFSPGFKVFISTGWCWQPFECISVYTIDNFLVKYEESAQYIDFGATTGYNWDRPVCFLDDNTLAIGYHPAEDEENIPAKKTNSEVLLFNLAQKCVEKRIRFDGFQLNDYFEVQGELYYDRERSCLIGLALDKGLTIVDLSGQILYQARSFAEYSYIAEKKLFYRFDQDKQLLETAYID